MKNINILFIILLAFLLMSCMKPYIAYFPFDGNTNDKSGNRHNGTAHEVTLTNDRFGNPNSAYEFNGINSNIIIDLNSMKGDSIWTIACWVKSDNFNRGGPFSLLTYTHHYYSDGFWWHFMVDGSLSYRVNDDVNGFSYINNINVPIEVGKWQHHIITIMKDSVIHYLNGQHAFTWKIHFDPTKLNSDPLQLRIGEGYNYENCYNIKASIDDIYVFNRALTEEEIYNLYIKNQ